MRARVEIDLGALRGNYRRLAERVAPARLLPVLKADAYGHGAVEVARALAPLGPAGFGVARVEEGTELRRGAVDDRVLVFSPFDTASLREMERERLTPVVSSLDQLDLLAVYAERAGWRPRVHLKVDSGMNRLGVGVAEAAQAISRLRASPVLQWEGLLSHFGDADLAASRRNGEQEGAFAGVLSLLSAEERTRLEVHFANSAAALTRPPSRFDVVRPGLALFGGRFAGADLGVEPVLSLRAPLLQVRGVAAGDAVGYGGRWRAPAAGWIGIVGVGYADGFPWRAGGRAEALIAGRRVPVIGAVSMDLLALDLGPGAAQRPGDEVVLVGRQGGEEIRVEELAERAGTIPYEILCQLRLRLPRLWIRSEPDPATERPVRIEVAR